MRLEFFDVSRRWPRQRTQRDDERGFVNSGILFYSFCSIRRPYITFKLPRGDMDMPPQFLPISGDRDVSLLLSLEWPVWSSSSGNNCHAVHRSLSSGVSLWSGTFTLSHIISRAHLHDFFQLLTIGMCHFRYLRNGRCDRHQAEITTMQFIGHSLPVHHFFLRHSENFFYLVSYCEPSCILHTHPISDKNFKKKFCSLVYHMIQNEFIIEVLLDIKMCTICTIENCAFSLIYSL